MAAKHLFGFTGSGDIGPDGLIRPCPMKICLLPALLLLTQCVQRPSQQTEAVSVPPWQPVQTRSSPSPSQAPPYLQISATAAPEHSPSAAWQRSSLPKTQALAGGAQMHEFSARSSTESAEVCVVTFDSHHLTIRIVDQPAPDAGGRVIAPLLRRIGATAGVNGGFFHPDFSTLGLMISDGRKTGQFAKTRLVAGAVVALSGEPYLVWNQEFLGENGVTQLLQAGPRLVDAGRPLPNLNRSKKAMRTFIATDGGRNWAIGTVQSSSLAGLAEMLTSTDVLPDLRITRALNLDGGRSTALYVRQADGQEISRPGWSTVRNYVAIIPR